MDGPRLMVREILGRSEGVVSPPYYKDASTRLSTG
jgi:hypothetical protein